MGNQLLFDETIKTKVANKIIKISGTVKQVLSYSSEYIVELNTYEDWALPVGVVYPKEISQAMLNELMSIKTGNHFEAIVMTRDTYIYVDIPVWDQNGVYRTEP